jgi:hypothetical protein
LPIIKKQSAKSKPIILKKEIKSKRLLKNPLILITTIRFLIPLIRLNLELIHRITKQRTPRINIPFMDITNLTYRHPKNLKYSNKQMPPLKNLKKINI